MTPYYPWRDLHPFALIFTFEYFLDCFKNQGISSINHSILLQVVHKRKRDLRPDLVTEIFEHGTINVLGVVDGNLLRNSVTTDNVLPEKFLDSGRGYIGYRSHFHPFGEVLHCDDGEGILSLCWCEFTHDVDAPPL
jgi:hypothetical protein